ncbi:LD-carboxypeptidase [Paramagnetospirillum marisnigri]|uniref:LD-carboxypeptidase n=1 Tax=Paramagnetospirillum marisnigri TaxID=1285242 RepID=A0A178MMN9_9PROT|nr:LD-carboxypeptidase [Paramagnetospirillum marisnigri]OAN49951.1 LD-carboxypeptidase [Paramagnetospirillum marisnigri]
MTQTFRIGVVAPASPLDPSVIDRTQGLVRELYPGGGVEVVFHPQCLEVFGHFAGDDDRRAGAFLDYANDDGFDAVWFGRGGYGSCRMVDAVLAGLTSAAWGKAYLGYSDMGTLLAALYGRGFSRVAHGPMASDLNRRGGAAAVARALSFLVEGAESSLEPSVSADGPPTAAFNITILAHLMGSPLLPDLTGHVLMLEEVGEYLYRMDRDLCQITGNAALAGVAGIRLGRCSDIPDNQPDFGQSEEEVMAHWCRRSGIPYLGRADIGHDVANKVVPFGRWPARP